MGRTCQLGFLLLLFAMLPGEVLAEEPAQKTQQLIPLSVGNRWDYRTTFFTPEGKDYRVVRDKNYVQGFYDFPQGRLYCVNSFGYALWMRNTARGVEDTGVIAGAGSLEAPIKVKVYFQYPTQAGNSYKSQFDEDGEPIERVDVVSTNAKVVVPAGTFECIHYRFIELETGMATLNAYAAPGVGVVKYEDLDLETGKVFSCSELAKVTLKAKTLKTDPLKTEGQPPTVAKPDKPIMPLTVGNQWTFRVARYDAQGQFNGFEKEINTVKGVFELPQGKFYAFEKSGITLYHSYLKEGIGDTVLDISDETALMEYKYGPDLCYRFPARAGDSYISIRKDDHQPYERCRVVATDVRVEVPAGTFQCIQYNYELVDEDGGISVQYVAPGVGLVRFENLDTETKVKRSQGDLIKYELK